MIRAFLTQKTRLMVLTKGDKTCQSIEHEGFLKSNVFSSERFTEQDFLKTLGKTMKKHVLIMASCLLWSQHALAVVASNNGDFQILPVVVGEFIDDPDDAFGNNASEYIEINQMTAYRSGGVALFSIDYERMGLPAKTTDKGQSDVIATIEIDADRDFTTGDLAAYDGFCPQTTTLGVEYRVEINGQFNSGSVELRDELGQLVSSLNAQFSNSQVQIELPLDLIGSPQDVYVSGFMGTQAGGISDCAPDDALLALGDTPPQGAAVTVPVNHWLSLLFLMLMVIGLVSLGKQKATQ